MRAARIAFTIATIALLAACGQGAAPTSTPAATSIGTVLLPGTPGASSEPTRVTTTVQAPDSTAPAATGSATRGVSIAAAATPTPLAATHAPLPATAAPRTTDVAPTTGAKAAPPTPTGAATTARATDLPTSAPQEVVGTQQDGLVLLNVRSANHDGYTRLVFDLTKSDGSAAPVPRTRVWTQGGTVIVAMSGVRNDEYGQSLGGGEVPINLGSVSALYRIPVRDDASVAYGITVKQGAKVTVSATTGPARVIVDISDK